MRTRIPFHAQLVALATRRSGWQDAEDLVQDALLAAIEAGRHDLADPANIAWLRGVVRNRARMAARAGWRRRGRDGAWQAARAGPPPAAPVAVADVLAGLPPALKSLAALALTGHDRREIAYLLRLPDSALRQRIVALKRRLKRRGLAAPAELAGLDLDLAYGRIRQALLPALRRHGGLFASHDPDGHLFILRRSQNAPSRQQDGVTSKEGSP